MPALQPKENWEQTGRWDTFDILYKLKSHGGGDLALGPTHEEIVTPLIKNFINSYRDLPVLVYQIQSKYRDEARAKSGLLRGREFRMKDMYSFHVDDVDLDCFYERVIQAYRNVYERCGLGQITMLTYAAGGSFARYSHEFQVVTPYGEDTIYHLPGSKLAINKELVHDVEALKEIIPDYRPGDESRLEEVKAIEVGNIFKLGVRFTSAFETVYTDSSGIAKEIPNGCYGIGTTRLMGAIAECLSDERGLVWPEEVAPFRVHLISLARSQEQWDRCNSIYKDLISSGVSVLYDDRLDVRAGVKLADADLLGMPYRLVVSPKTLENDAIEWKQRKAEDSVLIPLNRVSPQLFQTNP